MYYQLLFHTLDPVWHYNIYLDIKDNLSSYRTEKLKDILNVRMEIIEKFSMCVLMNWIYYSCVIYLSEPLPII